MILGDDLFYECPNCGDLLSTISLISGNTIGSTQYSDGYQVAFMLPHIPLISRCFNCNTLFWLDENTQFENTDGKDAKNAEVLRLEECQMALDNENYKNPEDEIYLRTQLWWAYNDRVRGNKKLFSSESDKAEWRNNLEKLLDILDLEYNEDIIMMVEIYRNLGDFNKSKALLSRLQNDEIYDYDELKKKFKKELIKKNTLVFKI